LVPTAGLPTSAHGCHGKGEWAMAGKGKDKGKKDKKDKKSKGKDK
jgi:hypothetical protein